MKRISTACLVLLLVTACGGGGGGSGKDDLANTETVVFTAQKETAGLTELYAMQEDGSGLVKLSGTQLSGGVGLFKLSADKRKVAYVAAEDTAGVFDLYVVNIDGTERVRVSQGFSPGRGLYHGNVGDTFWWSPDSTRLVYLADVYINDISELFLVNADGSDNHRINGGVGTTVKIGQAKWSPDSRYVAYYVRSRSRNGYISDRFAINTHDTMIGGRDSVRVSGSAIQTTLSASLNDMVWSPDSTRIGYVSYENSASMREIYIAIAGQTMQQSRINIPLSSGQGCFFRIYWSGDSRYLLYYATPGLFTHDTLDPTPRNGVNISGNLASGRGISRFGWSPDFNRVAYTSNQDDDSRYELYSALPGVTTSGVKLSGALTNGGNVTAFKWSPDNSLVAYIADQDTDDLFEVFTAAGDGGGGSIKVSHPNLANGRVDRDGFSWSPDGQYISYSVNGGDQTGIYVTTPQGNLSAAKVSGSQFTSTSRFGFQPYIDEYFTQSPWTSDSTHLLFSASVDPSFPAPMLPYKLYRAKIDETQSVEISGSMAADGGVRNFDY